MLPDVVNDDIVKAAKNMGLESLQSFFYRSALEVGYHDSPGNRQAEDEARKLYNLYSRQGYKYLPPWCKAFAKIQAQRKVVV